MLKYYVTICSLVLFAQACFAKSLTEQLKEKAQLSAAKTPNQTKAIMKKAIDDLKATDIIKKAKKKGDQAPRFKGKDPIKGPIVSLDLLKKGPIVLTFYRGSWCPYCNLQLRDLQSHIQEIKALGAELVAVSPEAPDRTLKHVKKQKLDFYVLSDTDGSIIESFGLMYNLPKDLIQLYKKFGINLPEANKSKGWSLPLSATYIINQQGKIVYSFLDADYKKRAETKDLVSILKKIKKK